MRYPLTVAFMVYHEGDPELGDVIDRVAKWITANSRFDVSYIIKKATWDGKISLYTETLHFLDPRDVDWTEIPPAKFVVLLWSCDPLNKPYWGTNMAAVCPSAGGHVYGAQDYAGTGRISSVISVPYHTGTNPMLPERTDTTDPDRAGAIAVAIAKSGWQTGLEATIIHEFESMLVGYLRDLHDDSTAMNTYRPGPTEKQQAWIDCDNLALYPTKQACYKAMMAQFNTAQYEKLADYVPIPPVEITLLAELRQGLVALHIDLIKLIQLSEKL